MPPTGAALLGFAAWTIFLVLSLGTVRTAIASRGKPANSFKPSGEDLPGLPHRLTRAHANCYENLPAAAAIMLYAVANGQTAITDPLAYPFLAARIAQSLVHMISVSNPAILARFALFIVQQVILVIWILQLTGVVL